MRRISVVIHDGGRRLGTSVVVGVDVRLCVRCCCSYLV